MTEMPRISVNGSVVRAGNTGISLINRGMMYGDGCFETLRTYDGKFLEWDAHFNRLQRGLNYLEMELPVSSEELKTEAVELLRKNDLLRTNAMIRIQVWRDGERGFKATCRSTQRMIQAGAYTLPSGTVDLHTSTIRCIPSQALERRYKLTNSLNYIKAAQEAVRHGKDDALMLTVNGYVSETTIANLFWIKDECVFTPSEECDLLPGVTRAIVMDVIKDLGITLKTGRFEPQSIYSAESVFCTNSLKEIQEVGSIDENEFITGHEITNYVKKAFHAYKNEYLTA